MQAALATEMPELARHRTRSASQSIGRWRADLPDDLQEACATAFREALATFGYEPYARPRATPAERWEAA